MSKDTIIKGTLILTFTTIIVRIIGFIFRIYLANAIGAEGMGLYQLILSFYFVVVTIASSGLSVAVSRVTAEEMAKNKPQNVKEALYKSILIATITSTIAVLIIVFGAKPVSTYILNDTRAILPLYYLAPSLPFMSISACFRGYFYAIKRVIKPASAQFFEQLVRMFIIIGLLNIIGTGNIEYACVAAVIGMTIGEIFSCVYIWFLYIIEKKEKTAKKPDKMTGYILKICMPVAGTSYLNSILRLVENALIPVKLVESGLSLSTAMSLYGMIKGMVMPLLFFPSSFLSSLATMLIPSISSDFAVNNHKRVTYLLSRVIQFTLLSGIFVVSVFLCFPYEFGIAIYDSKEVGFMLRALSFVCPFIYLNMVIISILNALNEQVSSFKINLLESVIKITMIYFLVPVKGFNAYLTALFLTTILNTILYIYRLLHVSFLVFDINNWIFKPIYSAIIAGVLGKALYCIVFNSMLSPNMNLFMSTMSMGIIFLMLLIVFRCITLKELAILKKSLKK